MDWTHALDIGEKIAKIVAVFVGGLWVYFNSFRGRTFVPRLQVRKERSLQQSTVFPRKPVM